MTTLGISAVIGVGLATAGISSWASHAAQSGAQPILQNVINADTATTLLKSDAAAFPQPLPVGVSWPNVLPANLLEKGVVMDPLVPRGVLSLFWRCAWESSYVKEKDSGNPVGAATSLEKLASFTTLPFYREQLIDPQQFWYTSVVEATRAGDDSNLRNELAQCTYFSGASK